MYFNTHIGKKKDIQIGNMHMEIFKNIISCFGLDRAHKALAHFVVKFIFTHLHCVYSYTFCIFCNYFLYGCMGLHLTH